MNWTAVSKFADQLSEASKEKFQGFVAKGCWVAKTLQSTLNVRHFDQSDGLSRGMRRVSLLENVCIAPHMQQTKEDLPFNS